MATQASVILQAEHLTRRYGTLVAVDDLSLNVYEGEVFGFLGPNGAGKTTSIHMLCGLLRPDAGRVLVRGIPIHSGSADVRARVGMCPQELVLWERLTCQEQLVFVGQMYGVPGRVVRGRAGRLLEELGLEEKRHKQAHTLSGGMQRRLNLALALIHDPEIVVLDEPEAGLDPQSRVRVREYIRSLARHKTVILTTHNMDEAERVADRVAIIDHGRLLVLDTPEALKQQLGTGDVVEIGLEAVPEGADPAALINARLASQAQVATVDGVLTVRAPNAASLLPVLLETLGGAGVHCGSIHLRENTLEDVFIRLTGRRLRE